MGENEKKCPCDALLEIKAKQEEQGKRLNKGDTNFEIMNLKLELISKDTSDIKLDLKCLADKPAKRWDTIVGAVLTKIVDIASLGVLFYIAKALAMKG